MMLMLIQKEMFILQKAVLFIRGGMVLLLNFSDAELQPFEIFIILGSRKAFK
jgi:hypothetical protein